jgi:adenylate kinase
VLLAGRPGAGKGVQGVRLARRLGVQYLSTGDVLRHEIAIGSALGNAVERLVANGRLLPTGLIVAIVESNLDGTGYVLDGFPRTVAQAETLFAQTALDPTVAIEITVPAPVATARLRHRGRPDDDAAVVRERLATYDTETVPALDVLDRRGLLIRVDGHAAPDTVERNVLHALQCFRRAHDASSLADAWRIGTVRNPLPSAPGARALDTSGPNR